MLDKEGIKWRIMEPLASIQAKMIEKGDEDTAEDIACIIEEVKKRF